MQNSQVLHHAWNGEKLGIAVMQKFDAPIADVMASWNADVDSLLRCSYRPCTTTTRWGVAMIGERWTNKSPVVRLSLASPAALLVIGPVVRQVSGRPISLAGAIGCTLLLVAWMSFVAWRLAMNAKRQGDSFGDAR